LPAVELADFRTFALEKPVAEVTDEEVEQAVRRLAEQNRPFHAKEGAAAAGDRLTISFSGKIDGQPFEGGTGEDVVIHLGSGMLMPGFDEQLVGGSAGETRTVQIAFPHDHPNAQLAGKEAVFEVVIKSVETPGEVVIDDAFANSLGLDSLAKLQERVKEQLTQEHAAISRQRLKCALLDQIDAHHKFELPPTLLEDEFANVWRAVTEELAAQNRTFADEGTTEEAAKAEYRAIAERRVRLGLVLAEVGERNNIKVTDEELTHALVAHARRFPGREQQVWDYYRKNAEALASLRAPIYEDKVVDFVLELVKVTEKPVSREQLYKGEGEGS